MKRVLVIDDHDPSRAQLVRTLGEYGYEVAAEGKSGAAALSLAQTSAPDVVLMAVGLGDIDGIDAARELMRSRPVPVVVITTHHDVPTVERAKEAGIMAYLAKPLRTEELAPALELAISRFEEVADLRRENSVLKENLEARKLIERAKGLLMEQRKLSEEQAYSLLKKASMNMRRPMADVAQAVLVAGGLLSAKKS